MSESSRPLRALRAVPAPVRWLAPPVVLLGCVAAVMMTGPYQPPTSAPKPPADAVGPCQALMKQLPAQFEGHPRTDPSPYVAVWATSPRTVLRCGVPRPASLDAHASDRGPNVDGVQWYMEGDGHGGNKFTLTLHQLYVEVAAPKGATPYPTDPLGPVSPVVLATIPDISGNLNDPID
ncbi:DUF3515 domain-containing protein [Kitasatospora sp. RB6PN24]|uniref:DUF3515 domain-containing protein n=1 Tax=Kitasatospora humi TaxID=2893891 RepID=UPI001E41B29A|nr:DUF3515 domain-containing protein [Kitasatospora humi]MCC9308818.1 DUF3515 domain-containing protein [Kitasatospora humi]